MVTAASKLFPLLNYTAAQNEGGEGEEERGRGRGEAILLLHQPDRGYSNDRTKTVFMQELSNVNIEQP